VIQVGFLFLISYQFGLFFLNLCIPSVKSSHNNRLTCGEDFNFAEIHWLVDQRKLYNDESKTQSAIGGICALNTDCSSVRYIPRILTTQSVVPQNRCENGRLSIGQTDDEVVGSVT